jgi:hypothetical protein
MNTVHALRRNTTTAFIQLPNYQWKTNPSEENFRVHCNYCHNFMDFFLIGFAVGSFTKTMLANLLCSYSESINNVHRKNCKN